MPFCSRCGVELPDDAPRCVLCATPVQFPPSAQTRTERPYPDMVVPDKTKGIVAWAILTTIFSIAVLSLCAINLYAAGAITWCPYPAVGIAAAWIYATIAVFLIRRRWIAGAGWIATTIAFLAALSMLTGSHDWFWPLAFPITIVSGLALMIMIAAMTRCRSISAILAIILATAGMVCVGVDCAISRFLGELRIGWSLIPLSVIVPVEALLLTYHLYFRKRFDLRRYFHV